MNSFFFFYFLRYLFSCTAHALYPLCNHSLELSAFLTFFFATHNCCKFHIFSYSLFSLHFLSDFYFHLLSHEELKKISGEFPWLLAYCHSVLCSTHYILCLTHFSTSHILMLPYTNRTWSVNFLTWTWSPVYAFCKDHHGVLLCILFRNS